MSPIKAIPATSRIPVSARNETKVKYVKRSRLVKKLSERRSDLSTRWLPFAKASGSRKLVRHNRVDPWATGSIEGLDVGIHHDSSELGGVNLRRPVEGDIRATRVTDQRIDLGGA